MSVTKLTATQIKEINHVRIHPGIGVSRVGDSKEFFIGPEVMNPEHYHKSDEPFKAGTETQSPYRESSGAIKRQAARFRVFGYNKSGEVVAEIHHEDTGKSKIEWTVEVANSKAEWFEFLSAMDIPEMAGRVLHVRNPDITDSVNREKLAIRPKPASISGVNVNAKLSAAKYKMQDNFVLSSKKQAKVMLGEVRTDDDGCLLFLPGMGKSGSPTNSPAFDKEKPKSFSNAPGWYDDVCDGPVNAKVIINGIEFEADSAWVISAPPNFAPDIISWRTMNDLMQEVFISAGMMSLPDTVSFKDHVLPIFQRLSKLQWVNNSFASFYGEGTALDFYDKDLIGKLARLPSKKAAHDPFQAFRRTIYNSFRPVKSTGADMNSWPPIYGDAFGSNKAGEPMSPRTYFNLPSLFNHVLEKWVNGEFVNDWENTSDEYDYLSNVPLEEQPNMLDQAAMHFCVADAFHPGCEITWPARHTSLYRAPYRIRQRKEGMPVPDYGLSISTDRVMALGGPLYEQGPGDLTRWMALPWQGDTAFCRSGYVPEFDPYGPAYWPARVPNSVLLKDDYDKLMTHTASPSDRLEAFRTRTSWYHAVPHFKDKLVNNTMEWMVKNFDSMGIVQKFAGPKDVPGVPEWLYVAVENEGKKPALLRSLRMSSKNPNFDAQLHQQTGFHNKAHLDTIKAARFGRNEK